jgi:pilus assembly protein CpaB
MHRRRSFLLLGLSILLGLAAVQAHRASTAKPAADPAQELVPVVIARSDLAVGDALDPRQLDRIHWPKANLPSGTAPETEALAGRILRRPVVAGEPILDSALLPAGTTGGLTAVIEPSHRAVSVKVDEVIGVAGFVQPGARVDVLTTLRRADGRSENARSRVILQNVAVLAVDQKMQTASDGKPEVTNVVTLSVDPDQAQRLVLGAHEGRLQLALRNPSDTEVLPLRSVSAGDVLGLGGAPAARGGAPGTSVQILKGTDVTSKVF